MDRSAAVARIKQGLGFYSGTARDASIVLALQEAQRELERGKTLPKFLLQEDEVIVVPEGEHAVALPTGFIRVFDEEKPHFVSTGSTIPIWMMRRLYIDASLAYQRYESGAYLVTARRPEVYVLRKDTIDFMAPANDDYEVIWSYYKKGESLATDVENEWLSEDGAPEWLIGEAGLRLALDMRDGEAASTFREMAQKARASLLADIAVDEEADGPFVMGAGS